MKRIGFAACLLLVSAPGVARAGLIDQLDFLQVTPFVGGQVVRPLGPMPASMGAAVFASGLTVGGTAGMRLGPVSLGVLVQRTAPSGIATRELGVDRVYGQLGFCTQLEHSVFGAHFDAGPAWLDDGGAVVTGFGGKMGFLFDWYPARVLSVGGGADFDVQAFPIGVRPLVAIGGTFVARLGLHL